MAGRLMKGNSVTYDGYPSDWYLRLTREGVRMLRAERSLNHVIRLSR